MKNIIVRVSEELHRSVKAEAAFKDITISDVVRGLLREWLKEDKYKEWLKENK